MVDFLVRDSDKTDGYLNHRIFACSYEPYWQRIRMESSFRPFDECRATLARLEAYVLRTPRHLHHDIAIKRWRVLNLLRAVPLGTTSKYGLSKIPRAETSLILEYRRKIRDQLNEEGYPYEWDWAITRANCKKLWHTDQGAVFLDKLYQSLLWKRRAKGKKPEMHYFLDIIQETSHYD